MMDLFIYFFSFFGFLFFFLSLGAWGWESYTRRVGCSVALAYMCYSCSNIVVFLIHIHAFKKPGCVYGSIVSPIMSSPYSNHRLGDSITSAWAMLGISVYVCVRVCIER